MNAEQTNLPASFTVQGQPVEAALRRAVRHALLQHKRAGNPVAVWRDGRAVWIPAEEIQVEEEAEEPTSSS